CRRHGRRRSLGRASARASGAWPPALAPPAGAAPSPAEPLDPAAPTAPEAPRQTPAAPAPPAHPAPQPSPPPGVPPPAEPTSPEPTSPEPTSPEPTSPPSEEPSQPEPSPGVDVPRPPPPPPGDDGAEAEDSAVLLPTLIPIVREGALDLEEPGRESRLAPGARYLDRVLGEAVQDLGLTLDVSERSRITDDIDDEALVERAAERWVISPRLERAGGQLKLRLLAVAPGSRVLMVRTQTFDPGDLEVRSMVMLRDLVEAGSGVPQRPGRMELPEQDERAVVYHARSAGRAVLALNAAA